jgi:hypothetical protein
MNVYDFIKNEDDINKPFQNRYDIKLDHPEYKHIIDNEDNL